MTKGTFPHFHAARIEDTGARADMASDRISPRGSSSRLSLFALPGLRKAIQELDGHPEAVKLKDFCRESNCFAVVSESWFRLEFDGCFPFRSDVRYTLIVTADGLGVLREPAVDSDDNWGSCDRQYGREIKAGFKMRDVKDGKLTPEAVLGAIRRLNEGDKPITDLYYPLVETHESKDSHSAGFYRIKT